MTYVTCPDCSACQTGGRLTHDDTCPLGRGYDEIQADDRMWFALRPPERVRRRPPHWSEIAELPALGLVPPHRRGARERRRHVRGQRAASEAVQRTAVRDGGGA
jgi:hypothetical protein